MLSSTTAEPQNTVSHVIFDLDGLLINSVNFYEAADKVVLQALGKAYSMDLDWKLRGRTALDCAKIIVDYYNLDMTPDEMAYSCERRTEQNVSKYQTHAWSD